MNDTPLEQVRQQLAAIEELPLDHHPDLFERANAALVDELAELEGI